MAWNDTPPTKAELEKLNPSEPSYVESFLRGGAQGATLGTADEATGALEALLDIAKSDKTLAEDFSPLYEQHRDESRKAYKAAEETNPLMSVAGNISGSLIPMAAIGATGVGAPIAGASELANLGRLGAEAGTIGAAAGLGTSEATDKLGLVKDTVMGGVGGMAAAGVGKALGAGAKAIGREVEDTVLGQGARELFKEGKAGEGIIGASSRTASNEKVASQVSDLYKEVQSHMDIAAAEQLAAIEKSKATGDLAEAFKAATESGNNPYDPEVVNKTLGFLKRQVFDVGQDGELLPKELSAKNIYSIRKNINDRLFQGGGINPNLDADEKNILFSFKNALNKTLKGDVEQGTEGLVPELAAIDKKIQPLADAMKSIGDPEVYHSTPEALRSSFTGELNKLAKSQVGVASPKEIVETQKFLTSLGEYDKAAGTNLTSTISSKMKGIGAREVAGSLLSGASTLSSSPIVHAAGGIKPLALSSVGLAGKAAGAVSNASNWLLDKSPEFIQAAAGKLSADGGVGAELGRVLNSAVTRDKVGRNALLFTISQNPEYRKLLDEVKSSMSGE